MGKAADLVWPPRSLLSAARVDRPGAIPAADWVKLAFLTDPLCAVCGAPLPEGALAQDLCGACLVRRPRFDRARAPLAYDDHARPLVLDLKQRGRRDGLPVFAAWMAAAAGPSLAACDLIAPTPLHWTKLWRRGFNQAGWLAQALAARAEKPLILDALVRVKRRRSQAGLSASERRRNVAGLFRTPPSRRGRIAGKTVLLVDDVFTTGATLEACARALKRAGASAVHAVTLARVVLAHESATSLDS